MKVFRLQKAKYKNDISGLGSTLVSGRWHRAGGNPILYTAINASLAILEYVVHLSPSGKAPDLVLLTIEIPDLHITEVSQKDLPANTGKKDYFTDVQQWGMNWLANQTSLAVRVPSVISPDKNVLVNPLHPEFRSVRVIGSQPFALDDRLS